MAVHELNPKEKRRHYTSSNIGEDSTVLDIFEDIGVSLKILCDLVQLQFLEFLKLCGNGDLQRQGS